MLLYKYNIYSLTFLSFLFFSLSLPFAQSAVSNDRTLCFFQE